MVYNNQIGTECITATQVNIIFNTRLFWRELLYWSRAFFNSVFSNIGSAQEVFTRLYYTPAGYAHMLQLILDRRVSDRFTALFDQYIIILRELVRAAANGETETVNKSVSDLYSNSKERAEFLSEVFPSLDKDVLEQMFNIFVQYEIKEINAYIMQDYGQMIETYDDLLIHTDKTADYLSQGIINLITAAPISADSAGDSNNIGPGICITRNELNTILDISMFWLDLFSWLRAYRISVISGIGNQELLYNRLLRVTTDFGNIMKTFLDDEIVNTHIMLIQEYLWLMDQLLKSRMADDIEEMNRIYQLTIDNIDERAKFLGSAFPSTDVSEWRNLLIKFHTYLIGMSGAFLSGDYAANIEIFDGLINQAEDMGSLFIEALFDSLSSNDIPA